MGKPGFVTRLDLLNAFRFRSVARTIQRSGDRSSLESDLGRQTQQSRRRCSEDVTFIHTDLGWSNIRAMQKWVSPTFKPAGASLADTIQKLKDNVFHPLRDDFLIIKMLEARIRCRRGPDKGAHKLVYVTLDHRRALCMYLAGVTQFRARVLKGPIFNEIVSKSGGYRKLSRVRIRYHKRARKVDEMDGCCSDELQG